MDREAGRYDPLRPGTTGSLGIGVLGAGRHGARYARHLAMGDVPGAHLAGLWRRDAEAGSAQAATFGTRSAPSPEALLEEPGVQAVVLAVPAGLHVPMALAAAQRGRALLLEKPMARTVAEAEVIRRAFEAAPAPLMIAQTLRFDPLLAALAEAAAPLAPLRGFSFEQRLEPRGLPWEEDPELAGGGVWIQTGIHAVDALRFVTHADLTVRTATFGRTRGPNESQALVTVDARGGPWLPPGQVATGVVAASKVGASRHHRYALYLEGGGVEVDLAARTLTLVRGRERQQRVVPEVPTVVAALRAFLGLVRDGAPNPVPAADAIGSLAVVAEAYAC